ncbi:hypothetical protein IW262DRAFT_871775 [Armillaria fumosa]|nr:hypothetical protein IW262DRAFT_871775 [Armillaria fumosa]
MSLLTLPVEVLGRIIAEAWALPLTPLQRLQMATSPLLVSRSFAWEFTRVFCTDIHILTPSHLSHVLRLILPRLTVAFLSTDSPFSPLEFCRSITFLLQVDPYHGNPLPHPAWNNIRHIMQLLPEYLPNVQRVSVNYHNWWCSDPYFACLRLPEQVVELDVVFTHSLPFSKARLEQDVSLVEDPSFALPGVKKLTVVGGNRSFVSQLVSACHDAKWVTSDMFKKPVVLIVQEGVVPTSKKQPQSYI